MLKNATSWFPVAILLLSGCEHFKVSLAIDTTTPVLKIASQSFNREGDLILAAQAAPAQLKTVEGFLAAAPDTPELLELVAQGYIEYAFGFVEDELESQPDDSAHEASRAQLTKRATDYYDRARAYAMKIIAADSRDFGAAFGKDAATVEAAAANVDKAAVAGLFYAGMALGSAINLNRNDVARIVELPKAIALIKRAYELNPKFYNGGGAMLLGVIYSSQGKAIGGNPEQAKKYFEDAIASTDGKFLLAKVMMARFYAVVVQDRALYDKTLKEVIDASEDIYPEYKLANQIAKRRAVRYLAHAEDYF